MRWYSHTHIHTQSKNNNDINFSTSGPVIYIGNRWPTYTALMSPTYYIAVTHLQFKHNSDFGYNSYTGISQLRTWKTTNQRARIKGQRKPYEKDRFRAVKDKTIPSCLDTHTQPSKINRSGLIVFLPQQHHNSPRANQGTLRGALKGLT